MASMGKPRCLLVPFVGAAMMAAVAAQMTVSKAPPTPAYEVANVREPAINGRPPVFDETDDGNTMID